MPSQLLITSRSILRVSSVAKSAELPPHKLALRHRAVPKVLILPCACKKLSSQICRVIPSAKHNSSYGLSINAEGQNFVQHIEIGRICVRRRT